MTALRYLLLLLILPIAIACAEDASAPDDNGPYTDATYDTLLNGNWEGGGMMPSGFTIQDQAISWNGCIPIPYRVIRDQIRTDSPWPANPDLPAAKRYRDIVIKLRFEPECVPRTINRVRIFRFIFTKSTACGSAVKLYDTDESLEHDFAWAHLRSFNQSCRFGRNSPGIPQLPLPAR